MLEVATNRCGRGHVFRHVGWIPMVNLQVSFVSADAKEKFSITGRYAGNDYSASAELTYTGERPDSAYSDIMLDAYTLLNLSATKTFSERIHLGLRLENITDEDYQLADGFNTAGRSAFFDIRYMNRR